ncbi:MAG: DNA recombination protein RmuC [Vampirovibrionales bacterium]
MIPFLWLLLGILLGTVGGALWTKPNYQHALHEKNTKIQDLEQQLCHLQQRFQDLVSQQTQWQQVHHEAQALKEERASLTAKLETLTHQLTSWEAQYQALQETYHTTQTQLTQRTAELASVQTQYDTQKTHMETWKTELETSMQQRFEALSLKALETLQEKFDTRNRSTHEERTERLKQDVHTLLSPLQTLIKENAEKLKAFNDQTLSESASLKAHLEQAAKQTQDLMLAKDRIVSVLTDNKGRGDWGELQLMRLLEMSGLQKDRDFELQAVQVVDGETTRPDVKVYLPNGHVVLIDAKTLVGKLESFEDDYWQEGRTQEERQKLTQSLNNEILRLNRKSYHAKEHHAVDFVILFVPRESMLRIPLEERPLLMEEAFQRGVILASPLILMAMLKTIAQGWTQAQSRDLATEIIDMAKELHKRAALLAERFETVQKTLDTFTRQLEDTNTTLRGQQGVMAQIKKLEAKGVKSAKPFPQSYQVLQEEETPALSY